MRTHTTLARTLAVALTTLAVGACSDATPPVAPVVPSAPSLAKGGPNTLPINGRIYFTSDFVGIGEVYSMKPDGSDRRRLTYTTDFETSVDVSRDGKKLAFGSMPLGSGSGELWAMNVDGTNRRLVTSAPQGHLAEPAWSPDGRTIAYTLSPNFDPNYTEIWSVAASGGKVTRLTPATQNASFPSWSPDGARIVYVASPAGTVTGDLYIMNADGSAPQLLKDCDVMCTHPSWSPDGTRIVYNAYGAGGIPRVEYCAISQGGVGCGFPLAEDVITNQFDLSPDGSQLVFLSFAPDAQLISTANANGGTQTAVTGNLRYISDMAWGR